mmetsp:Transcript_95003/g.188204  ORF Transcript_95003/g.188204 Transcript_95003/m.188204 type:complete len:181 (-) Transcript_95003:59-601(-)|eukprot:CAMPEP_0172662648 /NCGR_PEP_ID=MMETSP1074-20121228/5475_1 /TAXON_ID=2916 /ORGANISM="Ceratium fusus, Strain PA161109" /LENGTH=180 /DNA_ID=CAMNT_0013478575 /DNA_START=79 /DNA_END=621 /DNA_ORIENTATION=-
MTGAAAAAAVTAPQDSALQPSYDEMQGILLALCVVMLLVIGACIFLWVTDIYRLLPGWGPIRRFDSGCGNEDMRVRQSILHSHAQKLQENEVKVAGEKVYGSIGKATWGHLESSNVTETPIYHPVHGWCKIREGFSETQHMRAESEWWAKDEPHFLAEKGLRPQPLRINEHRAEHKQPMV